LNAVQRRGEDAESCSALAEDSRSSTRAVDLVRWGDRHPSLEGKAIVITGAGSGIGKAAALEAACRGARLVLVGRRAGPLADVAENCRRLGGEAAFFEADVAHAEMHGRIVDVALRNFGRLDGLVNSAGIARFSTLQNCRDDDVRLMFEVNFLAPLRLIREASAALRAAHGSVVNISSIGGVVATPRRAPYGAIKAALNHLTRSLARELAPEVRVNAVLPGPIVTPMWDDLGIGMAEMEDLTSEMIQTTPAGRLGRPEDVASWICELLGDRGGWTTGTLLVIDGGRSS
jgi:NAD(P)-dependent dehydrogenase (short-subunit alcohol dehydrogenase family)